MHQTEYQIRKDASPTVRNFYFLLKRLHLEINETDNNYRGEYRKERII